MDQLHNNHEQSLLMGKKARRRFEQLFTGQRMSARYAQLYRDLAQEKVTPVEINESATGG